MADHQTVPRKIVFCTDKHSLPRRKAHAKDAVVLLAILNGHLLQAELRVKANERSPDVVASSLQ